MVKHNNVIPNAHFKKYWQKHVETHFDQPGQKRSRAAHRLAKAKLVAPRPVGLLRPVVRAQTIRYNRKIRAGKGFSLDELKAAKIPKRKARAIGISVDHRRKNRTQEALDNNVRRLKRYKAKLVIFPSRAAKKNAKNKKLVEETKTLKQASLDDAFPLTYPVQRPKARKATAEEQKATATKTLRKAWGDQKFKGRREKRAKDKAAGLLKPTKKGKGAEAAAEEPVGDADLGDED